FDRCTPLAARLVRHLLAQERDPKIILNVNFPVGEFRGVKVTKLGKRIYSEGVIERLDPRGRAYYWIGGGPPSWSDDEGTGYQAVVLSKLCAKVFCIERVNELALRAAELVREMKIHNVSVKVFDGTYGWSDQAPFDRIIVAAAAPAVPEPLVQQLARKGKMVIAIGAAGAQRLARVAEGGARVARGD